LRAITYAIVTQLAKAGFSEHQLAEGSGEALTTYSDQLVINELMAVAGVKSRRNRSGGDGLDEPQCGRLADLLLADHVDVPLVTALDCYFIDFHGLTEWFWEGKRRFAYDTTPGDNGAICRLVNID
jgi:hypothetical protein